MTVETQSVPVATGLVPDNGGLSTFNDVALDWALVNIKRLKLLVKQDCIKKISHLASGVSYESQSGLLLNMSEPDLFFVAPSEELTSLPYMPPERFVMTEILHDAVGEMCWCWDEVALLNHTAFEFSELPQTILTPASPLRYATTYKDELVFYADINLLQRYVLTELARIVQ